MNNSKLPKRLTKEPIIDAIFEIRFDSSTPIASVLPGLFFSELKDIKGFERLPQAEIPEKLRKDDPLLQYLPIIKLNWMDYNILIGDRNLAIAANLPYKGWNNFKEAIKKILSIVKKSDLIKKIERYSTKYIDIVENDAETTSKAANITIKMGPKDMLDSQFHLKTECPEREFINVVQIISNATITLPNGSTKTGLIIDIDTIRIGFDLLSAESQLLEKSLDDIHLVSKETFFNSLTVDGISKLGPVYE